MSGAGGTSGFGYQKPQDSGNQYNVISFIIERALAKVRTIVPVKVVAVTTTGLAAPVGFCDVQPLVNQLDGLGNAKAHGTVFNLCYFRLQGGTNSIIIDPQVGDIGLAAICDRDITSVKNTKAIANPGSFRRFDLADGVYFGGILGGTPNKYLGFNADGITLTVNGTVSSNVTATVLKNIGLGPPCLALTDGTPSQYIGLGSVGIIVQSQGDGGITIGDKSNDQITFRPATGITVVTTGTNLFKATSSASGVAPSAVIGKFPTYQRLTGSGIYVPTDNTLAYAKVRMVAAGGGGGAVNTNNGNNGNDSSFDSWTAIHGNGGATADGAGGAGGTGGANGTGTLIARFPGGPGNGGTGITSGTLAGGGGMGGSNPFGGAGGGGGGVTAGANAAANTGGGGGGGGANPAGNNTSGAGGGAGEYVEFMMTAAQIGAGVSYNIGTKGTGGAAGGLKGGDGADGIALVEEFYN